MGFPVEINTTLKLRPDQGLDEKGLEPGRIYKFTKSGERIFPLKVPLFLANQDWEIIGTVEVVEYTQKLGETSGRYRVLDLFAQDLRQLMTEKFAKK